MHTLNFTAALLLASGLAAFGQASPAPLAAPADAWLDSVRQLPLPGQVAAVRARMLADTVYRGYQPALCRVLVGTSNGRPAPAVVRVADPSADRRPLGATLFYVVDNYPMTGNTAAAVTDFWRHAAGKHIQRVVLLAGPKAAAIYGSRAANGAVILSSAVAAEAPRR